MAAGDQDRLAVLEKLLRDAEKARSDPKKVAIVGGGMAGMTTAWELTHGENAGKFDVTVYQMGWRLGGKGASGRDKETDRIEEHGLHVWMGCYENAFGMMRACFGELAQLRSVYRCLRALREALTAAEGRDVARVATARAALFRLLHDDRDNRQALIAGIGRIAPAGKFSPDLITAAIRLAALPGVARDSPPSDLEWRDFERAVCATTLDCEDLQPLDRFPFEEWTDAFVPAPHVALSIDDGPGTDSRTAEYWRAWGALFPPGPGLPGDPIDWERNPFTLRRYYEQMLVMLRTVFLSTTIALRADLPEPAHPDKVRAFRATLDEFLKAVVAASASTSARAQFKDVLGRQLDARQSSSGEPRQSLRDLFKVVGVSFGADTESALADAVLDWAASLRPGLKGSTELAVHRLRGYLPQLVSLLAERKLVSEVHVSEGLSRAESRKLADERSALIAALLRDAGAELPGDTRDRLVSRFEREARIARRQWRARASRGDGLSVRTVSAVDGLFQALVDATADTNDLNTALARWQALLRLARKSTLSGLALLQQGIAALDWLVDRVPDEAKGPYRLIGLLDPWIEAVRPEIDRAMAIDPRLQRQWQLVGLVLAILRGIWRERLLTRPDGFDAIDNVSTRDWLREHKAPEEALDSPFINALHDLTFSNDADGLAASQGLRGAMRMFFTYRGALFWKMRAGMGDTVFTPLYLVLKARGVRFEFFHRLDHVHVDRSADARWISSLMFRRQVKVKGDHYCPIDARGFWPSRAYSSQLCGTAAADEDLEDPDPRKATNTRTGEDVPVVADYYVLAVGIRAIAEFGTELLAEKNVEPDDAVRNRWSNMLEYVTTIPTQSAQLWLTSSLADLGWGDAPTTLAGFDDAFDTWADMSQTLPTEAWPNLVESGKPRPRVVAYFCGALPDDTTDRRKTEVEIAERIKGTPTVNPGFLDRQMLRVWPHASANGTFDFANLLPAGRWDLGLYVKANVHPSDRYTLTRPGSSEHRISPLDVEYTNMTIAGDWTHCGFNGGCVEAAVMSGRLASHALSSSPPLQAIVGYDHP